MIIDKTNLLQQLCSCNSGKAAKGCCEYESSFNNIKTLLQAALSSPDRASLNDAEKICHQLLTINPEDLRLFQALSFIYSKTNQLKPAIFFLRKVTSLVNDPIRLAKYFSDIGNMLNILGETSEAEEALKKAIEFNPIYAPAYYNLGVLYATQKKDNEAIYNYKKSIEIDPSLLQAYNNLARILAGNPDTVKEALYCQRKAVDLSPNTESLVYNLGIALSVAGNFAEARLAFEQSLNLEPGKWVSFEKLLDCLFLIETEDYLINILNSTFIASDNIPTTTKKRMYFMLYLISFLRGDYVNCKNYLDSSLSFFNLPDEDDKIRAIRIFHVYINKLISYHDTYPHIYEQNANELIYVVGESHCLSPSHVVVNNSGKNYKIKPHIVVGCKIWHLISPYDNYNNKAFNITLDRIPTGSVVIFCFGEVDCRIDDGIIEFYNKTPGLNLEKHLTHMAYEYIKLLVTQSGQRDIQVIVQGVPAPAINFSAIDINHKRIFLQIIKLFNQLLKEACAISHIKFLDVYKLTVNEQGVSNGLYHLDAYHLKPGYIKEILKF